MSKPRHDLRCPYCRRFVQQDADGYYDREDRGDESSPVICFCSKEHADIYHARRSPNEYYIKLPAGGGDPGLSTNTEGNTP